MYGAWQSPLNYFKFSPLARSQNYIYLFNCRLILSHTLKEVNTSKARWVFIYPPYEEKTILLLFLAFLQDSGAFFIFHCKCALFLCLSRFSPYSKATKKFAEKLERRKYNDDF